MAPHPFSIESLLVQPTKIADNGLQWRILDFWAKNLVGSLTKKSVVVDSNDQKSTLGLNSRNKFECQECGKQFNAHYNLARHLPIHTGARPFVCKVCGKSFRQASTLCRHKIIHTEEKPHRVSLFKSVD
jgi:uncharacterized Zn-finger protein